MEVTSLHGHDSHSRGGEAGDGHGVEVMCSVYSLEARAKRSDLNFVHWELRVDKGEGGGGDDSDVEGMQEGGHSAEEVEVPLYVARHPGRRSMSDVEVELQLDDNGHSIQNTQQFNGQLAFVKLYA